MPDLSVSDLSSALSRQLLRDSINFSQTDAANRPDALAWAILALQSAGLPREELHVARTRLVGSQQADGRIALGPNHPDAYWPTPLAALAWEPVPEFYPIRDRAIAFLLQNAGISIPRTNDSPCSHDTTLVGWPWIAGSHSWVIPTSLAVMALRVTGNGNHPRVAEATRLLLDRQISSGGWNYGNTAVYGQKLQPLPETTGIALSALAGIASAAEISPSLIYLQSRVPSLRTPLSLSWSLLGLSAWDLKPSAGGTWLQDCWRRQERYGKYDITAVSLMLIALTTSAGLLSLFPLPMTRGEVP